MDDKNAALRCFCGQLIAVYDRPKRSFAFELMGGEMLYTRRGTTTCPNCGTECTFQIRMKKSGEKP